MKERLHFFDKNNNLKVYASNTLSGFHALAKPHEFTFKDDETDQIATNEKDSQDDGLQATMKEAIQEEEMKLMIHSHGVKMKEDLKKRGVEHQDEIVTKSIDTLKQEIATFKEMITFKQDNGQKYSKNKPESSPIPELNNISTEPGDRYVSLVEQYLGVERLK